ncbi:MAG: plasmid mobilization relaxosome protein MobC [Acutalibacteraceae bacterium]|nr:plasmid mobilization relaxosome protein MobC [Acutalibacteraceae bacterium]
MKNKKLSIRISESDLEKIHQKSTKAKLSLTDYVTRSCLGKQIFVIDGLDEVIRQQKAIGRNLNQLTTLCNMGKVTVINLSVLTTQYTETNKLLTDLLDRKRWSK